MFSMSFLILSDSYSRLQGLLKQFPKVDPSVAKYAIDADPTINKQYSRFILQWFLNGSVRLPEDTTRINKALSFYSSNTKKFNKKDISLYPIFSDIEKDIDDLKGIDLSSKRQLAKDIRINGSKDIYLDNEWRVIEMTTPEAVCELGKGTKWCTNADNDGLENAQMYLKGGPLLLFLHNENGKWKKYAQATRDLDQVMDILDKSISKPPQSFVEVLKNLVQLGHIKNDDFFNNYAKEVFYNGSDVDFANYFEKSLLENDGDFPSYAYKDILRYAKQFGRMKSVEDRIIFRPILSDKKTLKNYGVTDGSRIEEYVDATLHQGIRWSDEQHENRIANSTYAHDYWKDRYSDYNFGAGKPGGGDYSVWPAYEAAMFKNYRRAEEMVRYLWYLNGNKRAEKKFEDYLLKAGEESSDYQDAIDYAKNCNFRWPDLESRIIEQKDGYDASRYSIYVLKRRWKEMEPYILNNDNDYASSSYKKVFDMSKEASGWYFKTKQKQGI